MKHKRIFRERDHPRDKRGRFTRKGSGIVKKAAGALTGLSGEKRPNPFAGLSGEKAPNLPAGPPGMRSSPPPPTSSSAVRSFFRDRAAAQKLPVHDPAKALAVAKSPEIVKLRKIQAKPTQALKRDLMKAGAGTRDAKEHKAELKAREKAAKKTTPEMRAAAAAAPTNAVSAKASQPVAVAPSAPSPAGKMTPNEVRARFDRARTGDEALATAPVGMTDTLNHQFRYIDQTERDLRGIDPEGAQVLRDYRGLWYERMNANRRRGRQDARNDALDRVMERSPLSDEVVVHRGVVDPAQFIPGWTGGDVTGLEWDEVANASTSTERDFATRFLGNGSGRDRAVEMRIVVPAGVRGVQMSSSERTAQGDAYGEAELLLEAGLRFRVVADHGVSKAETLKNGAKVKGGVRRIDVEVLPPVRGTVKG